MNSLTEQLILAAEAGDTPAVQRLLEAGADIDARDAQGRTAVMAATHGNRVDAVRALIEAGADIDIRDDRHGQPLPVRRRRRPARHLEAGDRRRSRPDNSPIASAGPP